MRVPGVCVFFFFQIRGTVVNVFEGVLCTEIGIVCTLCIRHFLKGLEADETGGFQMDDLSGWLSGALALFVTVSSWTCSLSVTSMNGVLSDWRNAFCRSWSQENPH